MTRVREETYVGPGDNGETRASSIGMALILVSRMAMNTGEMMDYQELENYSVMIRLILNYAFFLLIARCRHRVTLSG